MKKHFVKEHRWRTIKGLLESYIGGRKKITANHIMGQMRSAVKRGIISPEECQKMIECVEKEIEANRLYPTVSKEEKIERSELIRSRAASLLLT